MGVSGPTTASMVAQSSRRGLVRVEGDGLDRRRNRVRPTSAGIGAAAAMEAAEARVLARMIDGLADDALGSALRSLERMVGNLDARSPAGPRPLGDKGGPPET